MIKLFEMFAGYGGASFALKKIGIEHEVVGYSEIDKYAIQCYEQNHKGKNYGDCTKINPNELPDFDLLTGGFPCQAFSVAGKGLGELDTRGTLFHEIIRIAEVKKPKMMLLENVKGITFKKHQETFQKILNELDRIGYVVKWKVLNSKDYGIPQNRERVFFVCFLKGMDTMKFNFPEKEELTIFLKDILESEVGEKYYLSEAHIKRLISSNDRKKGFSKINPEVAGTQTARQYANWKGNYVLGNVNPSGKGMNGNVYGGDIGPTITTNKGEGAKIIQINNPGHSGNRIYNSKGLSPSLRSTGMVFIKDATKKGYLKDIWIRKLTPTECFRLMGFLEDEINLDGISNSQRYKLAGNGWDINLVSKIFREMFKVKGEFK